MAADTFDPALINEFKKGIEQRDEQLVEKALESKVLPETTVRGLHPLYYLLATDYSSVPDAQKPGLPEDEFNRRTTSIINMLFAHGAKVAEPEKYATRSYKTLADRLLLSENLADASTVVLHAIDETIRNRQPTYKIDFLAAVGASLKGAGGGDDIIGHANTILTALERLHNTVRLRLENPATDLERDVAQHGTAVRHWTKPFKRPSVKVILSELFPDGLPEAAEAEGENLSAKFGSKAQPAAQSPYMTVLEQKKPSKILKEMDESFVGLDSLKREAKRLVFGQAALALQADGQVPEEEKTLGEMIIGNPGLGKSGFARKKAELLVSLGLAGPNYVEFNQENSAGPSASMTPKMLAALFAQADIINLELPPPINDGRSDAADFSRRLVGALKLSLDGRPDKPVIMLTGSDLTLKEVMETSPELKPYIANFTRLPDMDLDTLGKVLDAKLEGRKLKIDDDARTEIIKGMETSRKKYGKDFTNAREVEIVAGKLRDTVAERVLTGLTGDATPDAAALNTVKLADIKALNLQVVLAGPNLTRREPIGF